MRENVFSIPPHARFLPTLVNGVLEGPLLGDWSRSDPFWLTDVTIFLPTRRARLALAQAFADALGGGAMLPDIRTFGGDETEEESFLDVEEVASTPTPVPRIVRRFLLSELVEKWLSAQPASIEQDGLANPAHVLSMADSLARLIDDFQIEGVEATAICSVVPDELAGRWQQTLQFLEIALAAWPDILAQRGEIDGATLRNLRLGRQEKTLEQRFCDRPVVAAGSTGSVPATARLLRAITLLPRGVLVLPGLDTTMPQRIFDALLDQDTNPHGHPQYGLAQLLNKLERLPQGVPELTSSSTDTRTLVIRNALALAGETRNWSAARSAFDRIDLEQALSGVTMVSAPTEQAEARAVALAARDMLAQNRTVGIVTPDRNLARRIAAELRRFEIEVDDAAGTPLFQSRAGRLARLILSLAVRRFAPVDLMALLRNRYVTLGRSRAQIARISDLMEFALLRGQRPAPGLAGLRVLLEQNLQNKLPHAPIKLNTREGGEIRELLDRIGEALDSVLSLLEMENFTSGQLAGALTTCIPRISASPGDSSPLHLPGIEEMQGWAQELAQTQPPGPALSPRTALGALEALMAGQSVRARTTAHPGISIWGRLEARLQSADLMIACGLNEGVWPEVADPGPWLSRGMRMGVGLDPPERQHGLAAHDFEMALGGKNVVLAWSERIGTGPATPSRLVQRLSAFVGEEYAGAMRMRGEKWLQIGRRLDEAGPPRPAARPQPRPPAHLRPRRLSITEVETLFRSPFDLYAKHVLKLRPIDPLGEELGVRERGSFIHDIFEQFVVNNHDPLDKDAQLHLDELAAKAFSVLDEFPDRRDIWLRRFRAASEGYLSFERARATEVEKRFAEKNLLWSFPVEGERISLTGRADRIDLLKAGGFEIIDFKTGSLPTPKEMRSFLAPQLLLEALIVREAGFEGNEPAPARALTYIKIGAGPKAFELTPFALEKGCELQEAVDELHRRFSAHVSALLLRDNLEMAPRLMPKANQNFAGPYDHLARADEWTEIDGAEAEL
ncbi:MAG TPA: double-strand break repair protein AddB [Devosia sp.]|nr:double-strand break repair protein AddB [Devosia sp.]